MALSSTLASLSVSLREATQAPGRLRRTASVDAFDIKEMHPHTCTSLVREGFHFFGELLSFCSFTKIYPMLARSVPRGTPGSSGDLSARHSTAQWSVLHLECSFPRGQLRCGCTSGNTCCTVACRFFLVVLYEKLLFTAWNA